MNSNLMIPDFPHNIRINKIGQMKIYFCCILTLLCLCPVGCLSSYSYIMRKVWYHQIWIQNYLGFIVSDLTYIHTLHIQEWVIMAQVPPQEIYCRAMNPILLLKYHWDYGIYFQHFLLPDCQKRHKCCSFLCIYFKMG